jgi:sugar O-acyltransferase (sialic acid O-acetyltransferase NeuD family)
LRRNELGCIVYGAGSGFVCELSEILSRAGIGVQAYINNTPSREHPPGISPVYPAADIKLEWLTLPVVLPWIAPGYRKQLVEETRSLGFRNFPKIIDPSSIAPQLDSYGEGLIINASSVIGACCRVGRFLLVNRNASLGHDVVVEDFVSIGPGANVGSKCHLEAGTFVGIGATIAPEVTLGRNAIVGAGAVVLKDVASRSVVVGNPARIIKSGIVGYDDFSV